MGNGGLRLQHPVQEHLAEARKAAAEAARHAEELQCTNEELQLQKGAVAFLKPLIAISEAL